jgi:indolepyruvate ferredoxin oxidoreductase
MRGLRGTWADPFGHTAERRAERALIGEYEADMRRAAGLWHPSVSDAIMELARLPADIRGFGPVKAVAMAQASARRRTIWARIVPEYSPTG